jgi:two-component system LytT family response regulator
VIRAVIVEDEAPARRLLRHMLRDHPDVQIVGEHATGERAVAALRRERAEVAFLDVEMRGLDGFGVLESLPQERWPAVVFVTAHGHYALKAFEVCAVDYLLKPFDRERLARALARLRRRLAEEKPRESQARLSHLLEIRPGPARFAVRDGASVRLIGTDEIDWIEAEGNYVRLHMGRESALLRETLAHLEAQLHARGFVRIHRGAIVRIERVREIKPLFHGDAELVLADATRLVLSRTYREAFLAALRA